MPQLQHYYSLKKYGHDLGLSCVFRQHRAKSHCHFLHGYALAFEFKFGCRELDENGWVVDFGALKPLKDKLIWMFDHTLIFANDDPQAGLLSSLGHHALGIADVRGVEAVGMEAFAVYAYALAETVLKAEKISPRAYVVSTRVWEHEGNSAAYYEKRKNHGKQR